MKKVPAVQSENNRFCAFLRGVNVQGTNMKMAAVCAVFEKAGMSDVSSVLASGNILFSSERNGRELTQILEKAMSDYFSYDAFLFIRNQEEIARIFSENPFEADPHYHIYSFVGVEGIENTLMSEFDMSRQASGEKAQIVAGKFYWKTPKGNTLESEFGKVLGRKKLKNSFTSRNLNTIEKVIKKI